jgi:hypothetical protein
MRFSILLKGFTLTPPPVMGSSPLQTRLREQAEVYSQQASSQRLRLEGGAGSAVEAVEALRREDTKRHEDQMRKVSGVEEEGS